MNWIYEGIDCTTGCKRWLAKLPNTNFDVVRLADNTPIVTYQLWERGDVGPFKLLVEYNGRKANA